MKQSEKQPNSSTNKREGNLKFCPVGISFDKLNDPGVQKHSAIVKTDCNHESVPPSMPALAFDVDCFLSKNDTPSKPVPSCTGLKNNNRVILFIILHKKQLCLYNE